MERSNDSSLSPDRTSSHSDGVDVRTPEPLWGEGVLSHGRETVHDEHRTHVDDDEIQHLADRQIGVNVDFFVGTHSSERVLQGSSETVRQAPR